MPLLEQEVWIAQFAARLVEAQARFTPTLAREVGELCWSNLAVMKPQAAVATFLQLARDSRPKGVSDDDAA